jgi:hypothetical protein
MPCAKSQLVARYDKDGKLKGVKLRACSGTCNDGQTKCTETGRPDPDDDRNTITFCACPEDIVSNPLSREGLVRSCRVGVLRRNGDPIDFVCIGFCRNDETTECRPVVVDKIELATGEIQKIIECQCIEKVDPIKDIVSARRKKASKQRRA